MSTAGVTLDTGALIALEKGAKRMRTLGLLAREGHVVVTVPAPVLEEWWRGRSQQKYLAGMHIEALSTPIAKAAGEALGKVAGASVGIDLSPPAATWPTYEQTATFACSGGKSGLSCFTDADGDGKPGVSVTMRAAGTPPSPGYGSSWHYTLAPTDALAALSSMGATNLQLGLRVSAGSDNPIRSDCGIDDGDAEASDLQFRMSACTKTGGSPCTGSEAQFVDQNMPTFHLLKNGATLPSTWMSAAPKGLDTSAGKGARASTIRLGDFGQTFSCTNVRAAFPN